MLRVFAATVLLVGVTTTTIAQAGSQCYRPADIEAEQAVLYQTELMVLSDSCGSEQTYVGFTTRVKRALVAYQKQMSTYLHRNGGAKGQAAFDTYITKLANEAALKASGEPRATVCQNAATFLAKAEKLEEAGFKQLAAERAAEHKPDYKRCSAKK